MIKSSAVIYFPRKLAANIILFIKLVKTGHGDLSFTLKYLCNIVLCHVLLLISRNKIDAMKKKQILSWIYLDGWGSGRIPGLLSTSQDLYFFLDCQLFPFDINCKREKLRHKILKMFKPVNFSPFQMGKVLEGKCWLDTKLFQPD